MLLVLCTRKVRVPMRKSTKTYKSLCKEAVLAQREGTGARGGSSISTEPPPLAVARISCAGLKKRSKQALRLL